MATQLLVKQKEVVQIGSRVTIRGLSGGIQVVTIINLSNIMPGNGVIFASIYAPLGRALLGREVGDLVSYEAPQGTSEVEILAVQF